MKITKKHVGMMAEVVYAGGTLTGAIRGLDRYPHPHRFRLLICLTVAGGPQWFWQKCIVRVWHPPA